MRRTWIALGIMMIGLTGLGHRGHAVAGSHLDEAAVPVELVSDYLHSVIQGHRAFYTVVVERIQRKGKLVASENWRTTHMLPLPVQLLKEADELGALTGSKIRYRLIGLWPINKQNMPVTEREKMGLEEVRKHPEQRSSGLVSRGDARYFQAIYADRAVNQACVGCHNLHPESPKHNFQLDDVMGGLVIEIPLEK